MALKWRRNGVGMALEWRQIALKCVKNGVKRALKLTLMTSNPPDGAGAGGVAGGGAMVGTLTGAGGAGHRLHV